LFDVSFRSGAKALSMALWRVRYPNSSYSLMSDLISESDSAGDGAALEARTKKNKIRKKNIDLENIVVLVEGD